MHTQKKWHIFRGEKQKPKQKWKWTFSRKFEIQMGGKTHNVVGVESNTREIKKMKHISFFDNSRDKRNNIE